jgi:hypothetical protein
LTGQAKMNIERSSSKENENKEKTYPDGEY